MQKALIFFTFFFTIIVGFLYYCYHSPEKDISLETIIEIPEGSSVKTAGKILKQNGIINNANIFYYTVRLLERDYFVQSGKFVLYKNFGVFRSMEVLRGRPIIEDIALTIPEGLTVWETASIAAYVFENVDSAEFVLLCENREFIEKCGFSDLLSLEGYLYPETYKFPKNTKSGEIILRMTAMHKKVFSQISRLPGTKNLTDEQIVILASVIEKESKVNTERSHVSGVFYNRLEKKMPLGADATVRYAVKNFNRPIRKSELNSDSPYNTRKFTGLPVGAICSPSKSSLVAALNPLETKDLFFMAKWDGSGEHIFSQTNEQHEKVKSKIKSKNKNLADF
ncbi:MAG: endolytic transglycosylase MltG [Chitinispirillales bacterium]|jgi:UPF0755 protein|nr:endolytic transglycosylase MltG [Chitinispirillales bacterium]